MPTLDPERQRLAESDARKKYWRRWGPYLAERACAQPDRIKL